LTKILEREYDDETEKKLNFCYRNSWGMHRSRNALHAFVRCFTLV
jgi:hypothetical protein